MRRCGAVLVLLAACGGPTPGYRLGGDGHNGSFAVSPGRMAIPPTMRVEVTVSTSDYEVRTNSLQDVPVEDGRLHWWKAFLVDPTPRDSFPCPTPPADVEVLLLVENAMLQRLQVPAANWDRLCRTQIAPAVNARAAGYKLEEVAALELALRGDPRPALRFYSKRWLKAVDSIAKNRVSLDQCTFQEELDSGLESEANVAWRKLSTLYARLHPKPEPPAEAVAALADFERASQALPAKTHPQDFQKLCEKCKEAIRLAPWYPDAWWDCALAAQGADVPSSDDVVELSPSASRHYQDLVPDDSESPRGGTEP